MDKVDAKGTEALARVLADAFDGNPEEWVEYSAVARAAIEAYLAALPASGGEAAAVRAHALAQLRWHDERTQRVHDIVEELREIVLAMPAAERPDGLMKKAQDAVYGMRGRVRLLDDAAITAALSPVQWEPAMSEMTELVERLRPSYVVDAAPCGTGGKG